jgi:hypothetical protein
MDYRWDQLLDQADDVASLYVYGYGAYTVMADHLIDHVIDMGSFTAQVYELRAALKAREMQLEQQSVEQLQDYVRSALQGMDSPDSPSRTLFFVSDENDGDQK